MSASMGTVGHMARQDVSSGSPEFDSLRQKIASDQRLKNEVEALMLLIVETYNPSDWIAARECRSGWLPCRWAIRWTPPLDPAVLA